MVTNKPANEIIENFKKQAEALSANLYRVNDMKGAGEQLAKIVEDKGAKKIAAAPSGMVSGCLNAVEDLNTYVYSENLQLHVRDADIGLSEVGKAVAETGSLIQDGTVLDQRLVSTLPPVHVALVPTGGLIETFNEAIDYLNEKQEKPAYVSFISGPSRTADIERVLTIGVHGPGELHIILVDEAGGEPGEQ
ncbi:MAG: lactate utilization protein [Clostridiales bacterium]|nr:lactate utilization protein [Clostridiales bacterium]